MRVIHTLTTTIFCITGATASKWRIDNAFDHVTRPETRTAGGITTKRLRRWRTATRAARSTRTVWRPRETACDVLQPRLEQERAADRAPLGGARHVRYGAEESPSRSPPTLSRTMRYSDMEAAFTASAAQGIHNFKTKRVEPIPAASVAAVLATVRQTFVFLLADRLRIALPAAEASLETTDLRPYLPLLVEASEKRAYLQNHAVPRNAPNHARRFLRTCFPAHFARPRSNGGSLAVPPLWTPILDAVEQVWTHAQTRRQYRSDIARLSRILFAAGHPDPAHLPDRAEIERLLAAAGLARRTIACALGGYMGVVRHLGRTGSPIRVTPLPKKVPAREVGLRSLPAAAFAGLPTDKKPGDLRNEDLLPHIAPVVARAWSEWLAGPGKFRRPATRKDVLRALSVTVALLARRPELLADCQPAAPRLAELLPTHLFELRYEAALGAAAGAAATTAHLALEGTPKLGSTADAVLGAATRVVRLALVNRVAEVLAAQMRRTSPLRVSGDYYPPATIKVIESLWMLVSDLYRPLFLAKAPERWGAMRAQYHRLWQQMERANESAAAEGAKNKPLLVRTITLPQLVCVALPRLAAAVWALERKCERLEADAAAKGHDPARHTACKRARAEWEDRLEEYLALAVFTTDPLRNKNFAYAWLGQLAEVRPTIEYDPLGRPSGITNVESFFTGRGGHNPAASFKIARARDRLWRWSPAMMDFGLLLRYLTGPRRARIIAQGLLRDASGETVTEESYSLATEIAGGYVLTTQAPAVAGAVNAPDAQHNDAGAEQWPKRHLAFFVSPATASPFGGYDPDKVSDLYGLGLYAASKLLGRAVPATYEETKRGKWRSLFAAHVARLLWSTYWLGIREYSGPRTSDTTVLTGVQVAVDGTTDCERTLREEYTEVEAEMRNRQRDRPGDFLHPNTYDSWMDRAYLLERVDWLAEPLPLPAQLAPVTTTPPVRMRRSRRAPAEV